MSERQFDDLRPYNDSEIHAAMCRIIENPSFEAVAKNLFPSVSLEEIKNVFRSFQSVKDFQDQVMHHAVKEIIRKSVEKFSYEGHTYLDKDKSYLFVSNHRDILLDSALFELVLYENQFNTTEISFGSNLMQSSFIVDIGKSNKMYKIVREGNSRELFQHALHLSNYIRYTLQQKKTSLWIAQRSGRTKDGNDITDQGILKMFSMSNPHRVLESLSELNIVPVAISYQWETCDVMKVNEVYRSLKEKYIKSPGEDLQSILTGIRQFKGMVHISISPPISMNDLLQYKDLEKNKLFDSISKLMDYRIHTHYKLWNTNFIAYDMISHQKTYLGVKYTEQMQREFESDMNQKLALLKGDLDVLKMIFLGIYANPVKNALFYQPI